MIQRLMGGYKDESSSQYPAATINAAGCTLAQKALNRAVCNYVLGYLRHDIYTNYYAQDNGYVHIAPIVTERSRARRGEE